MKNKTFIVSHAKARSPLTITGPTLEEALAKEGLGPNIWKEVGSQLELEVEELGDYQGAPGPEDN